MTWTQQVLHVARKDVRLARWPILLYLVITGVATATSVSMRDIGMGTVGWSLLLLLSGMTVVAILVQADSPARTDAFWVTQPLRSSAVCAAKVLIAVVLLCGPALAGQLLALRAVAVPAGDYPALLAASAVTYGLWLGGIAVLAALTKSFRSLFVTVVALLFVLQWVDTLSVSTGLKPDAVDLSVSPPVLIWLFIGVLMLVVLLHQYRTRSTRRGIVLAAALSVAIWAVPTAMTGPGLPELSDADEGHADLRPVVSARLDTVSLAAEWGHLLRIVLRTDLPSGFRHLVLQPTIVLLTGDGREHALRATSVVNASAGSPWRAGSAIQLTGSRWFHDAADSLVVSVERTPAQAALLRSGAARLVLRGFVEVQQRQEVVVPLRTDHVTVARGARIRLDRVRHNAGDIDVSASMTLVTPVESSRVRVRGGASSDEHEPDFTLVNPVLGGALPLMPRGGHYSTMALILPGPVSWNGKLDLSQSWSGDRAPPIPADVWLQDAELHVTLWYFAALHRVEINVR